MRGGEEAVRGVEGGGARRETPLQIMRWASLGLNASNSGWRRSVGGNSKQPRRRGVEKYSPDTTWMGWLEGLDTRVGQQPGATECRVDTDAGRPRTREAA